MTKRLIKIAHSPDSDDAFMFYALKHGKVTSPHFDFEIERRDIEELNKLALEEAFDITAISFHAYAHVSDKYALLSSGSSMAEKDYGPMVVGKNADCAMRIAQFDEVPFLDDKLVAVPGEWTTAFLVLKMIAPKMRHKAMRFDTIIPAVLAKEVDAGLIIHEGQLQYERDGLVCYVKLTDFWNSLVSEAGLSTLPLPLGGNAVKKSLGPEVMNELSRLQKESIQYAMDHHDEARDYAKTFKRDLTDAEADKYLSWYANERTLDIGEEGKRALRLLFDTALKRGILKKQVELEIV